MTSSSVTMPSAVDRLSIGCRLKFELQQPTPMIVMLNVHYSCFGDLEAPDHLLVTPSVPLTGYRDGFGNWCVRLVAPPSGVSLETRGTYRSTMHPDPECLSARQQSVENLPSETLVYLLGSRYCDTDILSDLAWRLFEGTPPGWLRVQAICDHVHISITFDYASASSTQTAAETLTKKRGVCRDFAHLAIAFCRCMNIPARYCTGYLSDVGEPLPYPPGDFAAWMEVFLDDQWWTFDPRNNVPRRGRVLVARGRDGADVPLAQTFGPHVLTEFNVWAELLDRSP
jgi:transglutaminase-like putative cysteine protease